MLGLFVLFTFCISVLGFDIDSKSNVAVYWGQNSSQTEQSLKTYCESDSVDIVLLSFLHSFPDPMVLDLSENCKDKFSSGLSKCDDVGEDIKYCQKKDKLVLLSLGGAAGQYGFTSENEADEFSKTVWNKFGGGDDDERPFGDAVVDGFDFDFENKKDVATAAFGKSLRKQFENDDSKKYYLSAAPQCPYPDKSLGEVLENVELDFAFIQFYNNKCNLGTGFNWDTWEDYAKSVSPNPNIKLYLGQAGSPTAASTGYTKATHLQSYLQEAMDSDNFGGVSLWDASQAFSNSDGNYADLVKDILKLPKAESDDSLKSETKSETTSTTKQDLPKLKTETPTTTTAPTTTSTEAATTTTNQWNKWNNGNSWNQKQDKQDWSGSNRWHGWSQYKRDLSTGLNVSVTSLTTLRTIHGRDIASTMMPVATEINENL